MDQNKNSKRTLFIGGGALLFVILGITVISFNLISRAQQSCVTGYFYSTINGGCIYDTNKNGVDFAIYGGTNAQDRAHWNFTAAEVGSLTEDGTKRYVTTKCGSESGTFVYCNAGTANCADTSGAVPFVSKINERCVIDSSVPWSSSSSVSQSGSNTIVCRGGTPSNWTEQEGTSCSSMFAGTTLAIRCKSPNAYIVRTGEKDPYGYEYDSCSTSISGYVGCSYTLAGGSEKITVYRSSCPTDAGTGNDAGAGNDSGGGGGDPPPPAVGSCPKKPDPAKGTAEPEILPEGSEIKKVPSYYVWGCYSQPDKSADALCKAQAIKRTGNTTSPCVYGEESIICPKNGTPYKEGNFLKCAPIKKPAPPPVVGTTTSDIPQPIVITQTIRETVTVEVPSTVSVLPPDVVTEDSCAAYKKAVNDKILAEGEAILQVADTAFKASDIKNPEFKKVFYQFLKEGAKNSRNLKKLAAKSQCSADGIAKINDVARQFEAENLTRVKQSLVFLDKDTKVQNQYVGIQEDFQWVDKFSRSFKAGSAQAKAFAEDLKNFNELRAEFKELVDADKEGKVFGFEIEDLIARVEAKRQQIEQKALEYRKTAGASLKKGKASAKKILKKKKSTKKSLKKKSSKKKSSKKKSTKKSKKTAKKTKSSKTK